MSPIVNDILVVFGAISLFVMVGVVVIGSVDLVTSIIDNANRKYRIKHRFDKPPTAKCYCIDCEHWDRETGECYRFVREHRHTADNWFCWEAEPRKEGE